MILQCFFFLYEKSFNTSGPASRNRKITPERRQKKKEHQFQPFYQSSSQKRNSIIPLQRTQPNWGKIQLTLRKKNQSLYKNTMIPPKLTNLLFIVLVLVIINRIVRKISSKKSRERQDVLSNKSLINIAGTLPHTHTHTIQSHQRSKLVVKKKEKNSDRIVFLPGIPAHVLIAAQVILKTKTKIETAAKSILCYF